jgi:hypothetical protein
MRNSTAAQQACGGEGLIFKQFRHLHRANGTDENRNAAD